MTSPDTLCEWSGCAALATAMVGFGYRLTDPEPLPAMHELRLCDLHIEQVKQFFLVVDTQPLDDVPRAPRRRVRAA